MRGTHSVRFIPAVLLSVGLLSGASSPQGCSNNNQSFNVGPSKGQVTAAIVGTVAVVAVGTVVLVEVHRSHHTVKGCVSAGPGSIQVTTTGDKPRTYKLDGETGNVKVGDLVQFGEDKVKRTKESTADQVFRITKLKKDYGPCKALIQPNI